MADGLQERHWDCHSVGVEQEWVHTSTSQATRATMLGMESTAEGKNGGMSPIFIRYFKIGISGQSSR